ncbi:ATP-binding protein [Vreelandella rituensis]|uniref:histidine kinase n=1 Tax=Vreelandella rituensis TaxID=2282306 RepID=A0A368U6I9_9GAMM|nr:ATP-binding protein [Halomonas rituensis]RCV92779.1 HAMP domain-containing protein [Halomonas rituensis]
MRRLLSHGTFLRFYVLLGLALLMLFLLALSGRMLIEQVRNEERREQLVALPMSLLAEALAKEPEASRERALTEYAQQVGMDLALLPIEEVGDRYFASARLARGQVLVINGSDAWELQQQLPDMPWVLQAELPDWSERQWQGVMRLLGDWLVGIRPSQRVEYLATLEQGAWPLTLLSAPPADITPAQQTQLEQGQVVIQLVSHTLDAKLLYRLPGETQWLQAGPVIHQELLPLKLHMALLLGLMVVLALIIYLIMRSIETRMSRLELAATRIASGRLETRVKVESGDFLGRLGMAFNGMATQVQSLLRGQQEMIRAVSHELRTPVARIRFAVQMVEDMTEEPAIRRQLQGIDGDISELDDLVDEILTYARLGSESINGAEMETALIDCGAMAERVIETLSPLHENLSLQLVHDDDVELSVEPRYLQRALQNLVSNACRYARSRVVIRLYDEPHLVRIDVEDDGPGVPEEARAEIFKPFARLDDSRARSSGGYGLGLSIVEKIMAWHGGSVTVDQSPELQGARFTLLLPRRE